MKTDKKLYHITYKLKIESTEVHTGSALYDGYTSFDVTTKLLNDLRHQADSCGFTIESVSEIETKFIQFL